MKVAHSADWHVGFRSGSRLNKQGQYIRELDIASALRHAVDGMLAAKPDLVVICGDVFHRVSPTPAASLFAYRQVRRLRDAGLPVVILSGNHETPRVSDTGSPLHLFREIGCDVTTDETTAFVYPALDCRVVAVPFPALADGIPEPEGAERYKILAVHGAAEGLHYAGGGEPVIPKAVLESEAWSYIACGDWHGFKQVGPRAYYPGSLEFCSSDIWSEVGTPKGWVLADLESGVVEPQLVPTRQVLDLEPFDATGMTPAEVNAALAERLTDISGKLVRLKCLNIPTAVLRQLDHRQIKRWGVDALALKLDFLRPERVARELQGRNRKNLSEIVSAFLGSYQFSPGIDQARVAALGQEIMGEAQEVEQEKMAKRGAA